MRAHQQTNKRPSPLKIKKMELLKDNCYSEQGSYLEVETQRSFTVKENPIY